MQMKRHMDGIDNKYLIKWNYDTHRLLDICIDDLESSLMLIGLTWIRSG